MLLNGGHEAKAFARLTIDPKTCGSVYADVEAHALFDIEWKIDADTNASFGI